MLRNRYQSILYIVGFVILIPVIGLGLGLLGWPLQVRWLLTIGVFVVLLALVGREVTGREEPAADGATTYRPGRWDGILIDSARNKVSLSKLQLALWTVVVLSAWATFALHRVIPLVQGKLVASSMAPADELARLLAGGAAVTPADNTRAAAMLERLTGENVAAGVPSDALDVRIPTEVLAALGISLAARLGAKTVETNRAARQGEKTDQILEAKRETLRAQMTAPARLAQERAMLESRSQALESALTEARRGTLEAASADPRAADAARAGLAAAQAQWVQAQANLAVVEAQLQTPQIEQKAVQAQVQLNKLETAQDQSLGELHRNASLFNARWSDMLRGDTKLNFEFPDLGKIQMFFFTAVVVIAYAVVLWSYMATAGMTQAIQFAPWMNLPGFSEGIAYALALSNGGYLATKTTA
jgi:hypothetical protein